MGQGLLRADFEKVLVVIDGGSFLLWIQEEEWGVAEKVSHD